MGVVGLAVAGAFVAMGVVLANLHWWRVCVRETTLTGFGISLAMVGEALLEIGNVVTAVPLFAIGFAAQVLGLCSGLSQIAKAMKLAQKGEDTRAKAALYE
ncbi:MAG: hypothetical protein HONBIEJF_00450 [Fimbriimonadaceae bacterium]|nr:hypothetical protein [Fimbriimonadaceae bacterium]